MWQESAFNGNGYVMLLARIRRHKIVNMLIVSQEHIQTVKVHFASNLTSKRQFMFRCCLDAGFFLFSTVAMYSAVLISSIVTFRSFHSYL